MYQWFTSLNHVLQALLAGLFTWGVTAARAATVFVTRRVNRKLLELDVKYFRVELCWRRVNGRCSPLLLKCLRIDRV